MGLDETRARFNDLVNSIGRGNLNAIFPNDFEFYSVAFELVDGQGRLIDMLIFPVMPESLIESSSTITSVKKASSSIVSLFNPTFVPSQITLTGTFGRKFRLLLGNTDVFAAAVNFKNNANLKNGLRQGFRAANVFNVKIKTGYGVTKVLQSMLEKTFDVDEFGRPNKLFFFNRSFNTSYLVEIINTSFSQSDKSNNGYWDYSITMNALAPAFQVRQKRPSSVTHLMSFDEINRFLNDFSNKNRQQYLKRIKKKPKEIGQSFIDLIKGS